MLTARLGTEVIKASKALKAKDFVFRCRDLHCVSPEMLIVAGDRARRVPHFRHKSNCGCRFGVGETDWHREWKSHFDRVEVDMGIDPETGERNFADAVSAAGEGRDVVIEFQHSAISLKEQEDRERFYTSKGGLVWVHDASGKRNCKHFDDGVKFKALEPKDGAFLGKDWFYIPMPEAYLPIDWVKRPVGVLFDYGPERGLLFLMAGCMENGDAVARRLSKEEAVDLLRRLPGMFTCNVAEAKTFMENARRAAEQRTQPSVPQRTTGATVSPRQRYYATANPRIFEDAHGWRYIERNGLYIPLKGAHQHWGDAPRTGGGFKKYGGYKKSGGYKKGGFGRSGGASRRWK